MENNNQSTKRNVKHEKLKEALKEHNRLMETDEDYRKRALISQEKAKKYFLYLAGDTEVPPSKNG